MFWMLALIACIDKRPPPALATVPEVQMAASVPAPAPPPAASEVEKRIAEMIVISDNVDQIERLNELKELLYAIRGKDPEAQAVVLSAMGRLLDIEVRALPMPVADENTMMKIQDISTESLPSIVPTERIDAAAKACEEKRYEEAITLLEGMLWPEAVEIREQAIDGWILAEIAEAARLRQGRSVTALKQARDILSTALARYPKNSHAFELLQALDEVQAELEVLGE